MHRPQQPHQAPQPQQRQPQQPPPQGQRRPLHQRGLLLGLLLLLHLVRPASSEARRDRPDWQPYAQRQQRPRTCQVMMRRALNDSSSFEDAPMCKPRPPRGVRLGRRERGILANRMRRVARSWSPNAMQ